LSQDKQDRLLPRHIAIIMDGNGRWAKKRFLPRFVGHQRGLKAVKRAVTHCSDIGVQALTLFVFSTENWNRPKDEVNQLMSLFLKALQNEVEKLHERNVKVQVIGDRTAFSEQIQEHIEKAEKLTRDNTGLVLNFAANYGGRADIVSAIKKWQVDNPEKGIDQLDEDAISENVFLADLPQPDLLIRTGGEHRISNFLIWQMAYTEYFFSPVLWPDFGEKDIDLAIASYSGRERRFGKTSEQVTKC